MAFEDRMSDSDALMWSIEKDPMLRSTITTVVVLEGPVDLDRLHRTFERASRMIPRLRQRVRSNPLSIAPPRWEIDPNFDLRYHLRTARVPGAGTMGDLLGMAAPIAMQGFDRARPLWEATVVDGLDERPLGDHLEDPPRDHRRRGWRAAHAGAVRPGAEDAPGAADADRSPRSHVMNQTERFVDAFQHESRRQLGLVRTGRRRRVSRAWWVSPTTRPASMVASSRAARPPRPACCARSPPRSRRS